MLIVRPNESVTFPMTDRSKYSIALPSGNSPKLHAKPPGSFKPIHRRVVEVHEEQGRGDFLHLQLRLVEAFLFVVNDLRSIIKYSETPLVVTFL